MKPQYLRRSWAEINLDHLDYNMEQIRARLSPNCQIMGVVKADAYGHGDLQIAQRLRQQGVGWFGVSNLEEAMSLRRGGFEEEILIFGVTPPEQARRLALYRITQTVFSPEYAQSLSQAAVHQGVQVEVHIKADTGMGRIGFLALDHLEKAADDIRKACLLPGLIHTGIFTHFSVADELSPESREYTQAQFEAFLRLIDQLEQLGIRFRIRHCCNSAGLLLNPKMHLDMVRPGVILYGMHPSPECRNAIDLKPVMELKSIISLIKDLPPHHSVSYGRTFRSGTSPVRVATVPIGYADGYSRLLSNKARVLVQGKLAPQIGNVCMDQMMLDVTQIPQAQAGDVVTLLGAQGQNAISADDLAQITGTINYEITCQVSRRIPRVYLSGGKEIAVVNYLHTPPV